MNGEKQRIPKFYKDIEGERMKGSQLDSPGNPYLFAQNVSRRIYYLESRMTTSLHHETTSTASSFIQASPRLCGLRHFLKRHQTKQKIMLSTIKAAAMIIMTAMLSMNQLGEFRFPTPAGRATLSLVPVGEG